MVNNMESEVYEGDVYNSLTASIFELGNGSELIFLGIWLGKLSPDSMAGEDDLHISFQL